MSIVCFARLQEATLLERAGPATGAPASRFGGMSMKFYVLAAVITAASASPLTAAWGKPPAEGGFPRAKPAHLASSWGGASVPGTPHTGAWDYAAAPDGWVTECGDASCGCRCGQHCGCCCCCRPLIPMLLDGIGGVVHGLLVCLDNCLCGCGQAGCPSPGCCEVGPCVEPHCCGPARCCLSYRHHCGSRPSGCCEADAVDVWSSSVEDVAPIPADVELTAPEELPRSAGQMRFLEPPSSRGCGPSCSDSPSSGLRLGQREASRGASAGGNVSRATYLEERVEEAPRRQVRTAARVRFRIPRNPLRD
jgi:hypothetical protein